MFRSEVPESSPADDCPGHPPVPQHPQNEHKHQVTHLNHIFDIIKPFNGYVLKSLYTNVTKCRKKWFCNHNLQHW